MTQLYSADQWLVVENQGVLELTGLRLMGASSKRNQEGKIGTFGTGWKYAAACLLRAAGPFLICLGDRQVRVGVQPTTLRGEEHDEVAFIDLSDPSHRTVDGGFTTGLGEGSWEPWMAIRELLSNALDEGQARITIVDHLGDTSPNKTRVYIPLTASIAEAWARREVLFRIGEEPHAKVPGGRLLQKQDSNVVRFYKKGIFIQERPEASAFDYDFDDVQLGEDRLPRADIRKATWALMNEAHVVDKAQMLACPFEASCYPYHGASPDWKEAFGDRMVVTSDEGLPDQLIVPPQFESLATAVGARTKQNDLAMKAAERQTMPADGRVKAACAKLKKLGVDINPALVLLATIDAPFVVEDGLTYVKRSLDEDGIFCALACAGTQTGWLGSRDHLMALAKLLLR